MKIVWKCNVPTLYSTHGAVKYHIGFVSITMNSAYSKY